MTVDVNLTGAGWWFAASHRDPRDGALHGHTWEVTAWWPAEPWRDARVLQETLKGVLVGFDHKELPPELHSGEAIAKALMSLMTDCVGVDVSRPAERIYARVRA